MQDLPAFDALPFFEAAARLGSFTGAGVELGVTPAAVAYRIRSLETYLGVTLFKRHPRGVRLNAQGKAYLKDVQRILGELQRANDHLRTCNRKPHLKLVTVEVVAEKWLMPRISDFNSANPDVTIEFETDRGAFDPEQRDFDVWIAFTERGKDTQHCETLFKETLVPVCSPALLKARGNPGAPSDLHDWPLLYDLVWAPYWSHWFAQHDAPPADLSQASGFRLYSVMIQAAVEGMGVALGHSMMIADELERGTLVPLFDGTVAAPARYVLYSPPDSLEKPGVQAFRDWIRRQAAR